MSRNPFSRRYARQPGTPAPQQPAHTIPKLSAQQLTQIADLLASAAEGFREAAEDPSSELAQANVVLGAYDVLRALQPLVRG
jgi:hypothetical protein